MRTLRALVPFLCLAAVAAAPVPKNEAVPLDRLFPGARFDPAVPTQEKVLGIAPGARPMRHDELMRYVAAVASASKRVRVMPYAVSWEGRELVAIAISDEETIARLDTFKAEHAKRTDPRGRPADRDAEAVGPAKAVAWIAYGIHGDEISSTDAAAAVLYWLAAGEDEKAKTIRREMVVLIDPCENPDGRDRFLAQIRSFAHASPSADLEDLSHTAVWPQGRGNHYLIDMNRDWIAMVHPESRRAAEIASWNPQLMVDSHEMGADDTYLFSPARAPFNPFLPKSHPEWAKRYAEDQAKALDAKGYPYYTREWNEEFFPGYGSSWAMYRGAYGILYEMSGTDGTLVRKPSGEVRTYGQAVEHQVTSSIANLTTLATHRKDALLATIAARRDGIDRGTSGKVRAYVFPRGPVPDRTDALMLLLRDQGIEVQVSGAAVKASGLVDVATGDTAGVELPAGSYMVPMDQPSNGLARAILDPHVPMDVASLPDERKSLELGQGTRLYDTTAWSLPLAYGVKAYWTSTKPAGGWTAFKAPPKPPGGIASPAPASPFGWVFDGTSDGAAYTLADLLQQGVTARVAEKPFEVDGRSYGPGSVLIRREGGPDGVAAVLDEAGRRFGVRIDAVATALAEGGADLGGGYFHDLAAPRVGVFTGPAVARDAYGAIWHYLDAIAHQRFTALDFTEFAQFDLRRYNVLVLPPSGWSQDAFRSVLGKDGLEALKSWVEGGGTLIAMGSSASLLADKDVALTATRPRGQVLDVAPPPVWSLSAIEAAAAGPLRGSGLAASDIAGPAPARDPKKPDPGKRASPYDVAPVIGPGAKPFVEGFRIGTPLTGRPVDLDTWIQPALPPGQEKPKDADRKAADDRLRLFSPQGAFLRVDLDPELYLSWGLPPDLTVWSGRGDALIVRPPARAVAAFAGLETIHRGGLLWPEAAARLARTAYATAERVGRGQVILFRDTPAFRGWMHDSRRLFLNAILYGPGVGADAPAPW